MEGMQDKVFDLKFTAKSMEQQARHLEKEEQRERQAVAKALKAGKTDMAAVKAQIAIAKHAQSLNLHRLSGVLEIVATQLEINVATSQLSTQIQSLTTSIDEALSVMDVEKIARTMVEFNDQCQGLNVNMQVLQDVMGEQGNQVANPDAVKDLLKQVADELKIELDMDIPGLGQVKAAADEKSSEKVDAM